VNDKDKEDFEKFGKGLALAGTVIAGIFGILKKKS
jgi:hypothetical protein